MNIYDKKATVTTSLNLGQHTCRSWTEHPVHSFPAQCCPDHRTLFPQNPQNTDHAEHTFHRKPRPIFSCSTLPGSHSTMCVTRVVPKCTTKLANSVVLCAQAPLDPEIRLVLYTIHTSANAILPLRISYVPPFQVVRRAHDILRGRIATMLSTIGSTITLVAP